MTWFHTQMTLPRSASAAFLVAVIALLLAAVAAVQYRWVVELSGFQRQQMSQTAVASTDRLAGSLDRVFERLWYVFRVQADGDAAVEISQDHSEWAESFEFPQIIADSYWVTYSGSEEGRGEDRPRSGDGREEGGVEHRDEASTAGFTIQRISLDEGRFVPVEWPPWLSGVRQPLAAQMQAHPRSEFHEYDNFTTSLGNERIAFVAPQALHDSTSWTVVVLRRDVLVDQLLPALLGEHFGSPDERTYDVCVFDDADGSSVIFATAAAACPGGEQPPDLVRRLEGFGGSPHTHDPGAGRSLAVAVAHTAGSTEAVIAAFRQRNLLFGFGIVLLLGASVAVLAVASRRAQRLAERQIEFVAGVSHELRTPIAGISSLGQNLADGIVDDLEQAADYGDRIQREARRLANMVEGVLHFSAIRSERYRYEMRSVDLAAVVDEGVAALGPRALDEFSLKISVAEDLPPIPADRRALQSVVRNLLANAMKFSAAGGDIRIAMSTIDGDRHVREVELRVDDQGCGIPAAELPQIFEPFFRGEGAQAGQVQGSGLGLSLVKEVVEAHGGKVDVVSDPTGTSFRVRLPVPAVSEDGSA